MDLEVEVRRRQFRVAAVADVTDYFTRVDMLPVVRLARIAVEVRVVELVAGAVAEP